MNAIYMNVCLAAVNAYFTLLLNKYIRGKKYNSPCCSYSSSQVCLSSVWGTGTQFPLPLFSPLRHPFLACSLCSNFSSMIYSSLLLPPIQPFPFLSLPLVLSFPSRGHSVTSLSNTATGPLRAFQLDSSN